MDRGERPIKLRDSSFSPKCFLEQRCIMKFIRGRATDWARGLHRLPNPDKLRMLINICSSEALGAKVQGREGNNPD